LSYYAAATGTGYAFVYQGRKIIQGKEVAVIRQIYWARYIDWALSTPLIILNLGLLSGLPWLDIVLAVAFDEALFVNSLFGALRGTTR
jgi:bacteriorhodopsin